MRFTQVLCKYHIGRMIKKHWKIQGNKMPHETGAAKELAGLGIEVREMEEFCQEKSQNEWFDVLPFYPPSPPLDENHPLYNKRVCYMHTNNSVVLQGLEQAKVITNSVELKVGLPPNIENRIELSEFPDQDSIVQRSILSSHVYDAYQEKLPKVIDPARWGYVLPRVYGITDKRRSYLTVERLVHLCNMQIWRSLDVFIANDKNYQVLIEKDGDLISCEANSSILLTSAKPLQPFASTDDLDAAGEIPLPNLSPTLPTISLQKTHFYKRQSSFPILSDFRYNHLHTAVISYLETEITNLHGSPVTENQILGRALLNSFTIAASKAKEEYGESVQDLPSPVVVQCVQTDGRMFDFVVFQLNSLDVSSDSKKRNILWLLPRQQLFSLCSYKNGKPILEGYDSDVFKTFMALCSNH